MSRMLPTLCPQHQATLTAPRPAKYQSQTVGVSRTWACLMPPTICIPPHPSLWRPFGSCPL